jgi:hypothetical protein
LLGGDILQTQDWLKSALGLKVGPAGSEVEVINTENAAALKALTDSLTTVTAVSSTQKACSIKGLNVVAGGAGLADITLGAPVPGAICIIRIGTLTGGTVVVTGDAGVKLSGTNVKATFNAADEALILMYKAANTWEVIANIGGVVLAAS